MQIRTILFLAITTFLLACGSEQGVDNTPDLPPNEKPIPPGQTPPGDIDKNPDVADPVDPNDGGEDDSGDSGMTDPADPADPTDPVDPTDPDDGGTADSGDGGRKHRKHHKHCHRH